MSIGAIIPLKNEFGNVESMVFGASNLATLDEIVFIDGDSSDGTFRALTEFIAKKNDARMRIIKQHAPFGKFEAIKQAVTILESDNVLIWDGDNTIDYEDVQKTLGLYSEALVSGDVFLVANRLTSQREINSFRFINLVGNYLFSILMTPILNRKLQDVLSGLKIFPKYLISSNNNCNKLLSLDRYGDLTLLSIGRKFKLQFLSVPCRYKPRSYGSSSIKRWDGGYNLLTVVLHLLVHRCNKKENNDFA
jgi:glycosyltransferase involved in cell wall biosynthesis